MTHIIFGIDGQDGYYLAKSLTSRGGNVIGISRPTMPGEPSLADFDDVHALIQKYRPISVFHLAAKSTTEHVALLENHLTIGSGALHILEAVYRSSRDTKVFLSGSGLQFANCGTPINEHSPFDATSAYAAERIAITYLARYFRTLGVRVYVGYFFHHESPRRKERHISRKVALAAQRIASGDRQQLVINDLTVEKEWMFAGDATEAIEYVIAQEDSFEFVIGTGQPHSIREWVEVCFQSVGLNWRDHVAPAQDVPPRRVRLVSDPSKLRSLGWKPTVGFHELARIMMGPSGSC
jgi:GDPmannose 4,6-dehydratase